MSLASMLKSEGSLDNLLNQIECPLIYLSHDGCIQEANAFVLKVMQLDSKHYIGLNFRDVFKP